MLGKRIARLEIHLRGSHRFHRDGSAQPGNIGKARRCGEGISGHGRCSRDANEYAGIRREQTGRRQCNVDWTRAESACGTGQELIVGNGTERERDKNVTPRISPLYRDFPFAARFQALGTVDN